MKNPEVLIVDDNPADVQLLRWAFERAEIQCKLTVIEDGSNAMAFMQGRGEYAGATPPDLAILDLNLPKHDGLEILQAMRANTAFDKTEVAILSSSSSPRDRARMESFGIVRYITKPPDLEEFLQIGQLVKDLLRQISPAEPRG